MSDSAASAEDHQRLALFQLQHVVQAAESGHRVARHGACLLGRQLARNARDVVGLHCSELGVKPALWICQSGGIYPIAFLETADLLADSRDRARSVGAKHVGELRLDAEHLGESSLTFENVPNADACRL